MKSLSDFREEIHKCSKCGLCQKACPLYAITKSDCTVSRGIFMMLGGYLKNKFQMSEKINRYLDLCIKCGKCNDFCPAGINALDIIFTAKFEYLKKHPFQKFFVELTRILIFQIGLNFISFFIPKYKSRQFDRKVVYFGGCGSKVFGSENIIKLMNRMNIEVIAPDFPCCGIPFLAKGDLKGFEQSLQSYIRILRQYNISEILTSCANCEETIKEYKNWCENEEDRKFLENLKIRNIYSYIKEHQLKFKLKKPIIVTYHKPCNIRNFEDIEDILNNTGNLEYRKSEHLTECCGLNGLFNSKDKKTISQIKKLKREDIINTGAKIVLTSCLGCESALKSYSKGKYKVYDLANFISENS